MVFGWGKYVEAANKEHFAYWSGMENLIGFIRPEASRLSPGYWLTLITYNISFIIPLAVASESPLLHAAQATNPGAASLKRITWEALIPDKATHWPTIFQTPDLIIKDIQYPSES